MAGGGEPIPSWCSECQLFFKLPDEYQQHQREIHAKQSPRPNRSRSQQSSGSEGQPLSIVKAEFGDAVERVPKSVSPDKSASDAALRDLHDFVDMELE